VAACGRNGVSAYRRFHGMSATGSKYSTYLQLVKESVLLCNTNPAIKHQ
jgi:hypothetical protein